MDQPWILVPLGNPGPEYANTRHNLGRLMLQRWMAALALNADPLRLFKTGTLYSLAPRIQALVPATYMNHSGQVCVEARQVGLDPGRLLVLFDDKDLPLGTGRFRMKGRANGHNGLGSIMELLGTEEVARLRLGIGPFLRPLHSFVLGEWMPVEEAIIAALDTPFAAFMKHLAETEAPGELASKVNHEAFWTPKQGSGPE